MKAGEAFHQKHVSESSTACEPARHTGRDATGRQSQEEQQEGEFRVHNVEGASDPPLEVWNLTAVSVMVVLSA